MEICISPPATNGTVTAGSGTKRPSSAQNVLFDFETAYHKVLSDRSSGTSADRQVNSSASNKTHREKPVYRTGTTQKKSLSGSAQAEEGASAENAAAAQTPVATTPAAAPAESKPVDATTTQNDAATSQGAIQATVQGVGQAATGQPGTVDANAALAGPGVQSAFGDAQAAAVQGQAVSTTELPQSGQANAQSGGKAEMPAGSIPAGNQATEGQTQPAPIAAIGGMAAAAVSAPDEASSSTEVQDSPAADGGTSKAATGQAAGMASAVQGVSSEAVTAAATAANAQGTGDRSNGMGAKSGSEAAAGAEPVSGTGANPTATATVGSLQSTVQVDRTESLVQAAGMTGGDQEAIQQILNQVEPAIRAGKNVLHLQLQPESLGRIDLRIASSDQGVTVTFRASQASTQAMLENHAGDLRQALSEAGIHLSQFGVGQQGQPNGGFAEKQSNLAANYSQRTGRTEPILSTSEKTWKSTSLVDYRA
jgi:flagellar hook-length control protein FliK